MHSIRGSATRHAAAAALALAAVLLARTAAAQVYIVTPDPGEREASAATTIMLNPFHMAQTYDPADVHAIVQPDGSLRLSHPEAGMSFFSARVREDGSLAVDCQGASESAAHGEHQAQDAHGAEVVR